MIKIPERKEIVPVFPIIEEKEDEKEPFENENFNKTDKVNWEGEEVPDGPWIDEKLFMVGGMQITNRHVVIGSSTILIIIIVAVVICSVVSFYKRKEIETGARRLSAVVRRSISGGSSKKDEKSEGAELGNLKDVGAISKSEYHEVPYNSSMKQEFDDMERAERDKRSATVSNRMKNY